MCDSPTTNEPLVGATGLGYGQVGKGAAGYARRRGSAPAPTLQVPMRVGRRKSISEEMGVAVRPKHLEHIMRKENPNVGTVGVQVGERIRQRRMSLPGGPPPLPEGGLGSRAAAFADLREKPLPTLMPTTAKSPLSKGPVKVIPE